MKEVQGLMIQICPSSTRRVLAPAMLVLPMLLLSLILPASAAQAVLQPGEPAPPFSKKTTAGGTFSLDRVASGTTLLVFVKPVDRYASETLRALEGIFDNYPPLLAGLRVAIVVSRHDGAAQLKEFQQRAAPRWPLIADTGDTLYKAYKIVATPTIVIVGKGQRVAAVHPGYDLGLADDVRKALASARGITLPQAMTAAPAKPNMTLQMGRRMAARGLWEDALKYYGQAAKQGPLPPEVPLEIAQIHLEMGNAEAALSALEGLPAALKQDERARKIAERAREIKAGLGPKPTPPLVQR